jgi:hypothetical protein
MSWNKVKTGPKAADAGIGSACEMEDLNRSSFLAVTMQLRKGKREASVPWQWHLGVAFTAMCN